MVMADASPKTVIVPLWSQSLEILVCPACGQSLSLAGTQLVCAGSDHRFNCTEGIAELFWPHERDGATPDVTEVVRGFYEANPFPNYEDMDSVWRLEEQAKRGVFARLLDEQLPSGIRILEVGCGTGQLSNFLALTAGRTVIGVDLSMPSLRLGNGFARQHGIDRAAFCQMNLFRPAFQPDSFHLVICNGVLHHTSDPFRGLQTIAHLVKPGGLLIVGLYNAVARIPTHLRRLLFQLPSRGLRRLDARIRAREVGAARKHAWFMDQYRHPHESAHTFGEVLRWLDAVGLEFISSIPKCRAFEAFTREERLFEPQTPGGWLDRVIVQLAMLLRGGREGGFFVVIGRRRF